MKKQQRKTTQPEDMPKNKPLHKQLQPHNAVTGLALVGISCILAHILLVFVVPHITGTSVFSARTWGIHFIAYYPTACIVAFYAITFSFFIPQSNKLYYRLYARIGSACFGFFVGRKKHILFAVIGVVSVFVFRLLNARYALLGDGLLRVGNVVNNDYLHNEWGTIFVMHWFYKLVAGISRVSDIESVKLFANICGGFFVYTALYIADLLGKNIFEKSAVFCMYASFAVLQHFCGYVEVYALTVVLLTVYLYTGLLCLRRKIHWVIPFVVFVISSQCHLITIMFAPSLIYIVYAAQLKKYRVCRNPLVWAGLLIPCVIIAWPIIISRVVPELYPVSSQTKDIITLFSWVHFREYANGIVLGSGFVFVVTICTCIYALYIRFRMNSEHWFLFIASGSIGTCLFLFRGILGSSDWDTLAYAALAVNLFGIYLLLLLFRADASRKFLSYAVVVITGLMVVQTAAWIGINTGNASVKRFENIIMTDPGYYFIGHPRPMHISIVLERNNLEKEALIYYKLAYETYPNDPRCGFNYIMELCKTKQAVRADTVLGNLLNKNPEYTAQRMRAMFTLAQKEKQELFTTLALQHFYWGYCKNPDIVEKYFTREEIINNFKSLVELLTRTSDFVSAEPVLNTIMKLEPGNGFNHFMYAKIFFGQHKYDHAIEICNSLIASIPNIPFPYKLKAESYEKLHNKSLAIETLRNGITAVKDNSQKKDLQSSLDSLLHG